MRRERAYTLALRAAKSERTLVALPRSSGMVLSQGEFRAAPGGARLAWLERNRSDAYGGTLHVTANEADELRLADVTLFRFSPDGKRLALVRRTAAGSSELGVVDLATGEQRSLGALPSPGQLAWSGDDVIVGSQMRGAMANDQVEQLGLDGQRRPLVDERCVDELAVATRARAAIYLTSCGRDGRSTAPHLVLARFASGARRRIELGGRESIDNLEIAPDGRSAAWVIDRDVFFVDGKAAVARIAHERSAVHTLWFSDDGQQLLWASSDRVVVRAGGVQSALAAAVHSARFRRDGAGVLVAAEHEVIAWNPATGRRQLLGKSDATVEAADSFAGGLVLLTSVASPPVGTQGSANSR